MPNPNAPLSRDFPYDGKKYYRLPGSVDHAQINSNIAPRQAPHTLKLPQQSFQKQPAAYELSKQERP